MKIADNLVQIRNEISVAEKRFKRTDGSVCLLAVSKTRTENEIQEAIAQGQRHFGENYCQEAIDKIVNIKHIDLTWHFIGPVQSNKTRQIAKYFDWVHAVDRIKIARRLNEARSDNKLRLNICIQVNVSGEKSKSGISVNELDGFIKELDSFPRLKLRGLMALPAPVNDFSAQRKPFALIRQSLEQACQDNLDMDTLSMGTTQDMQAAIAEGATIVRIGTALFGARNVSERVCC